MDFDGDGRLDLLAGSNCCDSLGFHVFRRQEDGSWAPRLRLTVEPTNGIDAVDISHSYVTAADYNGDGVPDLLFRTAFAKGIAVALGPLRESQPIRLTHQIEFTPRPGKIDGAVSNFTVADWDRDGKPDLLLYLGTPTERGIYWYRNRGGPGLTQLAEGRLLLAHDTIVGKSDTQASVRGFGVGDADGDGWPDLIVARDELSPKDADGTQHWHGAVWLYRRE